MNVPIVVKSLSLPFTLESVKLLFTEEVSPGVDLAFLSFHIASLRSGIRSVFGLYTNVPYLRTLQLYAM